MGCKRSRVQIPPARFRRTEPHNDADNKLGGLAIAPQELIGRDRNGAKTGRRPDSGPAAVSSFSVDAESLILFVVVPVSGLLLGLYFANPSVLSGKTALGLSLLPFVGLFLAWVFC